jgi:hypothetical protein
MHHPEIGLESPAPFAGGEAWRRSACRLRHTTKEAEPIVAERPGSGWIRGATADESEWLPLYPGFFEFMHSARRCGENLLGPLMGSSPIEAEGPDVRLRGSHLAGVTRDPHREGLHVEAVLISAEGILGLDARLLDAEKPERDDRH